MGTVKARKSVFYEVRRETSISSGEPIDGHGERGGRTFVLFGWGLPHGAFSRGIPLDGVHACGNLRYCRVAGRRENFYSSGGLRVFGTFIGAVIAYVYLLLFPFTLLGMIVTVFLLDILCMLLGIPDDGKMATITLVIILLISKMSPSISPFVNGVLRFSEATVGALIGIALAWGVEQIRKRTNH